MGVFDFKNFQFCVFKYRLSIRERKHFFEGMFQDASDESVNLFALYSFLFP